MLPSPSPKPKPTLTPKPKLERDKTAEIQKIQAEKKEAAKTCNAECQKELNNKKNTINNSIINDPNKLQKVKDIHEKAIKKEDLKKTTAENLENSENKPEWITKEFAKKLATTSTNQKEYTTEVKKYMNEHPVLNYLDNISGGLFSALVHSNSLIGNFIRSFTKIPTPDKNMSPISKLTNKEENDKNHNAEKISNKIKEHYKIAGIKEKYNSSNKTEKIIDIFRHGFDVNKHNITVDEPLHRQKKTYHQITIKPENKSQFVDIYTFLQSPNDANILNIVSQLTKSILPTKGYSGDLAHKASEILTSAKDASEKGGMSKIAVDIMTPSNENIESGLETYSKAKEGIGFPSGLKISTTPNGNILINWSEKDEKDEEKQTENRK